MFRTSNRHLLMLTAILVIPAVVMSFYAHWALRFPGDLQVTQYLQSIDDGKLRWVMEAISFPFGGVTAAATTALTASLVWWRVRKLAGLTVLAAGALSVINYLLKWVINRPRPTSDLVHIFSIETGKGLPSGHAVLTTLMLGTLVYLISLRMRRSVLRTFTVTGLSVLLLAVGVSRVYLGVHWASDVIGGYLVGMSLLMGLIWSHRCWRREDTL